MRYYSCKSLNGFYARPIVRLLRFPRFRESLSIRSERFPSRTLPHALFEHGAIYFSDLFLQAFLCYLLPTHEGFFSPSQIFFFFSFDFCS